MAADVGQHHTTGRAAQAAAHGQEALMGQVVPSQHPAVVLRSHFNQLRALLAVALIALIGLTVAVVILASGEDQISDASSAAPIGHTKYGGLNPSTHQPVPLPQPQAQGSADSTHSEGAGASGKDSSKNAATGDNEGDSPESPNGPGARTD